MKKSLLVSIASLIGLGAFAFNQSITAANASDTIYTKFGPGILNQVYEEEYGEVFNPNNYFMSIRGGEDSCWLMLFPNQCDYQGIPFSTPVDVMQARDTDLSSVLIYTSETEYKTAKQILDVVAPGTYGSFNIFADHALNYSFPLGMDSRDIYKIVIPEGFVLPHGNSGTNYVIQDQVYVKNALFGTDEILNFNSWEVIKTIKGEENIPIAACNSEDMNYRIHIRDAKTNYGDLPDSEDTGNCYLLIFLDTSIYNQEIKNTFNLMLGDTYLGFYNYLDKIKCVPMEKSLSEAIPLREITAGKGNPVYNIWGERCSIAFKIGNDGAPGYPNYSGMSFSDVIIEEGCEFPSYATTHGDATKAIKYVQTQTIVVHCDRPHGYFNTSWTVNFSAGKTTVDGVTASKSTDIIGNQTITKTYVELDLSSGVEGTVKTNTKFITKELLRRIYVNGRSLLKINGDEKPYAFYNLTRPGTFAISVEGIEPNDIKEVIVKNGCTIPTSGNSDYGFQIYGQTSSYDVSTSVSYSKRSNGEFVKDDAVYWTIWFDLANPIRIKHRSYFYIENAPEGQSSEYSKFLYWYDEDGIILDGDRRIENSIEFIGKYLVSHAVTVVITEGKTKTIMVEHNKRLSDLKDPTRSGYEFVKWVDEDGHEFFPDNRITRDITITAIWEKVASQGCGGSLLATSSLISALSIIGLGVLLTKKKRA